MLKDTYLKSTDLLNVMVEALAAGRRSALLFADKSLQERAAADLTGKRFLSLLPRLRLFAEEKAEGTYPKTITPRPTRGDDMSVMLHGLSASYALRRERLPLAARCAAAAAIVCHPVTWRCETSMGPERAISHRLIASTNWREEDAADSCLWFLKTIAQENPLRALRIAEDIAPHADPARHFAKTLGDFKLTL